MYGNEAVVYGALLGGATHFFGYPITPASEISHAAAIYFPQVGKTFLQAESEVEAVNMIYGASAAGARAITASSGPGISLMQEGLSYIACAELPCVIVDVQRAGPGLGNIWPEQGDYNAVVKGGGHGNYKNVVLTPYSAQEMCDFTYEAFEIADRYRIAVFILTDAYIGQMMEPVRLPRDIKRCKRKEWALYADEKSRRNLISTIYMNPQLLAAQNRKLQEKYKQVEEELCAYEEYRTEDAQFIFIAFGICARICYSAVEQLRREDVRIGLFRPKTLFPFPARRLSELGRSVDKMMVVELNNGQMADDIALSVNCEKPVMKYNWMGGIVPSVVEIVGLVKEDICD